MSEEKSKTKATTKAELKQQIEETLKAMEKGTASVREKILETYSGLLVSGGISIICTYFFTVWWTDSWIPSVLSIEFIIAVTLIECAVYAGKVFNNDKINARLEDAESVHKGVELAVKQGIVDSDSLDTVTEFKKTLEKAKDIDTPFGCIGFIAAVVWIIHLIVSWIVS